MPPPGQHEGGKTGKARAMDEALIATLAKAAGLELALKDYADDVRVAAITAVSHRSVIQVPTNPAIEIWPPMYVVSLRDPVVR